VTAGLGRTAVRELAARHGIRPSKTLGQHFLVDPNLARAIAGDSGAGPGDLVAEVGAGLGSLTVALAATGARVLAIEFDRALLPALLEVTKSIELVEVIAADATKLEWPAILGDRAWTICANLPYSIATSLVQEVLEGVPQVRRMVVMVQREVGQRLVARAGETGYGPLSLRVEFHATAAVVRRVPPDVFWPRPTVESVVVRIDRRQRPAENVDHSRLWRVVDAMFAVRRKAARSALGTITDDPDLVLSAAGVDPRARAERLTLAELSRIAEVA
jgi:16S rRNA (adenine1518-N6/adenine1519-N6)-dimethyltransferase